MNSQRRVLIAEDDPNIRDGLVDALEMEGFTVTAAANGREALKFHNQWRPDLIILDIMMPIKSGYDVCREIRRGDSRVPIIMLTAKGEEIDKVVGLELGADDYVCKPFGLRELMARIHAVLRRATPPPDADSAKDRPADLDVITFGDVKIEASKMIGTKGKTEFPVTRKELDILRYFVSRPQEVVRRDELIAYAWGPDYQGFSRTLDQTIANLRKKIEDDTRSPRYVLSVYGVGYKFVGSRGNCA